MDTHRCYAAYLLFVSLTQVGACGGGGGSSSPAPVIQREPINDAVDVDTLVIDSVDVEPTQDGCTESLLSGCEQQSVSKVSLVWNTPIDAVDGYLIYMGPAAESVETPIGDFPYNALALIETGLTVTIDLAETAPLEPTETACFRLRSYNAFGLSDYSSPACINLLSVSSSTAAVRMSPG